MRLRPVWIITTMAIVLTTPLFARGDAEDADTPAVPAASEQTTDPPVTTEPVGELLDLQVPKVLGFSTDFSRTIIDPGEIVRGGPLKDGIPPVDVPVFEDVQAGHQWIAEDEPVFLVTSGETTHIYPVQILMYHEIVNDRVGDLPVSVTYCPLCNSGLAFVREFDGITLDFGTTGRVRYSNMVMYDRQTETWWQQATGEGLIGQYAGYRLELYPVMMLPWSLAAARFPDARLLSRDTGNSRPYGRNPYRSYDSSDFPFLYSGPAVSGEYGPMSRVLQIVVGETTDVLAYDLIARQGAINTELATVPIVVLWEPATRSALDASTIAAGRQVGTANAFIAMIDQQRLTFAPVEGQDGQTWYEDRETGSLWDFTGKAVFGPMEGSTLESAVGVQHFWFSYTAFLTDGRWIDAR